MKILEESFKNYYWRLNAVQLHTLPDQSDLKWSGLVEILKSYKVSLVDVDLDFLDKYVRYPSHALDDQFTIRFPKPGNTMCLKFHKDVTLRQLKEFVQQIEVFMKPLTDRSHLFNMLIFLTLKGSLFFKNYLDYNVKEQVADKMSNFIRALEDTDILLDKVLKGTATYKEISASGVLKKIDVEREFAILSDYAMTYKAGHFAGLNSIKKKLELIQFSAVVDSIKSACDQYNLNNCLGDPTLKELSNNITDITNNWSSVTDKEVVEKLTKVKQVLHLKDNENANDLNVFEVIIGSGDFFQFLDEKQFCDHQGKDIFFEQYRLITAQLQHEEYDEQVLNHLFAAFQIISPFMDTELNFKELMDELKDLSIRDACKYFETVKLNISLIRLWFSRAEVRESIVASCLHARDIANRVLRT